jgi:hypothetical protein
MTKRGSTPAPAAIRSPAKKGRPERPIDYAVVQELAGIMCTEEEIGTVLGFSREWINKRKKTDKQLADAITLGRETGKSTLRRMQWAGAMSGNATMLIWLGKQHLGQMDDVKRMEIELRKALDGLPDAQLEAITARDGGDE